MAKTLRNFKDLQQAGYWEDLEKVLCPRKILPPTGYPSPKHFAWGLHCNLVNISEALMADPKSEQAQWEAHVWSASAAAFLNHQNPCFFLTPELTKLLQETDPPKDVLPEDLELPYPCFGIILPETQTWPLLLISEIYSNSTRSPNPEIKKILANIPPAGKGIATSLEECYFPRKLQCPDANTHLVTIRGRTSGAWGAGWMEIKNAPTQTLLQNYEEKINTYYQALEKEDPDSATLAAFTLNFLCYLKYEYSPEKLRTISKNQKPAEAKGKAKKKGFLQPIFIGETPEQSKKNPKSGQHASPDTHWRRGHWHTILYGKGKRSQTRKWYRPTLVNPIQVMNKKVTD